MANNGEYVIRAIIPHQEDPTAHIVDAAGNYPEAVFTPEHRTYEGTLDHIGRTLGAKALSPDCRLLDGDGIVYRTKPLSGELARGFRWQRAE